MQSAAASSRTRNSSAFEVWLVSVGWQAICDEVGDTAGSRWVQIRKHHDDIAALGKDMEVAVHARGAAPVAELAHSSARIRVHEPECILCPSRCIDLSGCEQIGVLRIQQFVIGESIREAQEVLHGTIATARRGSAIRQLLQSLLEECRHARPRIGGSLWAVAILIVRIFKSVTCAVINLHVGGLARGFHGGIERAD